MPGDPWLATTPFFHRWEVRAWTVIIVAALVIGGIGVAIGHFIK